MLFKHAARGDERAFLTFKNVEASSITTGMGVALRLGTAASFDGTSAVRTGNAADMPGFLGVAVADVASNAFGLVQCFGNVASVLLSGTTTSITITAGDPLVPSTVAGSFFSLAPTYATSGFGYVITSNPPLTLSNTSPFWCSGFVRALK